MPLIVSSSIPAAHYLSSAPDCLSIGVRKADDAPLKLSGLLFRQVANLSTIYENGNGIPVKPILGLRLEYRDDINIVPVARFTPADPAESVLILALTLHLLLLGTLEHKQIGLSTTAQSSQHDRAPFP
jgi:hypothetical protein